MTISDLATGLPDSPAGTDAADTTRSLADVAYTELRTRILGSQLLPGTALSVPALARTMQISRSPVREAVQRLIHEGLATHSPNRGAEVTVLRIEDLREIYQVKEPLAALATRLAATRLTEPEADTLLDLVAEQERALERHATQATMMGLDIDFHRYIALRSGNATLAAALDQFTDRTNLAFPSAWGNVDYARYSVAEHRAIAESLHRGDADEADRSARAHLRNVATRLDRFHRSLPRPRR